MLYMWALLLYISRYLFSRLILRIFAFYCSSPKLLSKYGHYRTAASCSIKPLSLYPCEYVYIWIPLIDNFLRLCYSVSCSNSRQRSSGSRGGFNFGHFHYSGQSAPNRKKESRHDDKRV
jgi:hypothetical protein